MLAPATPRPVASHSLRVVVADDDPAIAQAIAADLRRLGHVVLGPAGDGREAVRLCREGQAELALLDLCLPGLDGLAAARLLAPEVPVVLMSALQSDQKVDEAAEAGVYAYLVKPCDPRQLGPSLTLARRQFVRRGAPARRPGPASLRARCFGYFQFQVDGQVVPDSAYKRQAKALLQNLLLWPGTPQSREALTDRLFPGYVGTLAHDYMNKAFCELRKALAGGVPPAPGTGPVLRQGDTYVFAPQVPYESDLEVFRQLLRAARRAEAPADRARLYERALECYTGDLFADQHEAAWVLEARRSTRSAAAEAAEWLAYHYARIGDRLGRARARRRLAELA